MAAARLQTVRSIPSGGQHVRFGNDRSGPFSGRRSNSLEILLGATPHCWREGDAKMKRIASVSCAVLFLIALALPALAQENTTTIQPANSGAAASAAGAGNMTEAGAPSAQPTAKKAAKAKPKKKKESLTRKMRDKVKNLISSIQKKTAPPTKEKTPPSAAPSKAVE
ncbi:MAG TPA: hypothetical protein VEC38_00300 [Candidatus Binataceae bacterium]|nr:hypothetical protein [Candidatus Binataceae bacterium]